MDTVNRIKKLGKLTMRLTDFDCISQMSLLYLTHSRPDQIWNKTPHKSFVTILPTLLYNA